MSTFQKLKQQGIQQLNTSEIKSVHGGWRRICPPYMVRYCKWNPNAYICKYYKPCFRC